MECLAIFERGYLYPSSGSIYGVKSECPFCIARHTTEYRPGDVAVMLQMTDAGRQLTYISSQNDGLVDQFKWLDEPRHDLRLLREHWLTLPLEALTIPFWLPRLSIRNCFVIDELAVWHSSESAAGSKFHWNDGRMIEIVRVCWRKRLPVTPSEISKVLLAHGMPEQYQQRSEELFSFGIEALVASEGRNALKKLRNEQPASERLFEIWNQR